MTTTDFGVLPTSTCRHCGGRIQQLRPIPNLYPESTWVHMTDRSSFIHCRANQAEPMPDAVREARDRVRLFAGATLHHAATDGRDVAMVLDQAVALARDLLVVLDEEDAETEKEAAHV